MPLRKQKAAFLPEDEKKKGLYRKEAKNVCAGDRTPARALPAGFRDGLSKKGSGILHKSLPDQRKGGYISGKDALGDARQVAAMLKEKGIADKEVEQRLIRVACRMMSDNRQFPLHEAIRRAFWLYDASGKEENLHTEA